MDWRMVATVALGVTGGLILAGLVARIVA